MYFVDNWKINDECWYNRVGNFLASVRDQKKEILYGSGPACTAQQNNPAPECGINGTVECEQFICLFSCVLQLYGVGCFC